MGTLRELLRQPHGDRVGWPEVLVCFLAYVVLVFAGIRMINAVVPSNTIFYGLSFSALSALAGIGAFFAAYFLRLRGKAVFGVCPVSGKWLLMGIGVGVGVFVLAKILSIVYFMLGGAFTNIQEPYQAAATGGTISLVMQMLLIAVATPIGEELAFRGILTNALLRLRPWVAILVSSLVFALAHGLNEVMIPAFITGLGASCLFYKTKSVWPGVVVHATNNALATILSVLLASIS